MTSFLLGRQWAFAALVLGGCASLDGVYVYPAVLFALLVWPRSALAAAYVLLLSACNPRTDTSPRRVGSDLWVVVCEPGAIVEVSKFSDQQAAIACRKAAR